PLPLPSYPTRRSSDLTVTDTAGITSSDSAATLPANTALAAGTRNFSVTLNTAGSQTVTATDITDTNKTANTSPPITVNPGAANRSEEHTSELQSRFDI